MAESKENYFKSLDFNLGMLRYADAKGAALLAFVLWLGLFLIDHLLPGVKTLSTCESKVIYLGIVILSIICFSGAFFNLSSALWSRVKVEGLEKTNLFCVHISEKKFADFKNEVGHENFDYTDDVINQIYANSVIATAKFKCINASTLFTLPLIVLTVIVKTLY